MKRINWTSIRLFSLGMIAGALAVWVIPVVAQEFNPDNPPVGLDQAIQLTGIAQDKMREGDYKSAIHALHSASFILEEGLGMHMGGMGMQMGGMDMPMPMMGPLQPGGRMEGRGERPDVMQLDQLRRLIGWLKDEHGLDVTDLTARADELQKAVDEDRMDDAERLRVELHRLVNQLMEENGIELPAMPGVEREFPQVMEMTRGFVEELTGRGVDVGDIPARLDEAQNLFDQGDIDGAREILRAVKQDLRELNGQSEE
jgi:hypothetical protein